MYCIQNTGIISRAEIDTYGIIFRGSDFLDILLQTAEGVLFSAVLLLGAAFFLRRRERLYVEAEAVVAQYADGRFDVHLPIGETGAVHRFFGKVEQLAMSLQAKS